MKVSTLSKFMEMEENKTVLLVDFYNLVYRTLHVAFYQVPEDTEFQYWKYLMINSLFASLKQFKPNKVIFAIDMYNSWRKKIYKEYKANRKEQRDKSKIDYKKFYEVLDDFILNYKKHFSNIYFLRINEAEGDDVIATICKSKFEDYKKIIISGDEDFIQLLQYKNVKIFNPNKKDFTTVLNPKIQLELKILTGDKSDNISAVKPKCGIKTAEKILNSGLDVFLQDEVINDKYKINRQLIDFEYIPSDISKRICEDFDNYELKKPNAMKILMWFGQNKINKFSDEFSFYFSLLEKLN
jgi:5'-3' exonuclease